MHGDASFDPTGRYRWRLRRWWSAGPVVAFVMLNPNRADATTDDPTIRRCIGFARAWGFGALEVVNLYAWRCRDPRELRRIADPVGSDNDRVLAALHADRWVAAWGASGRRAREVLGLVPGRVWWCLGTTRGGQPRHPLYLRRDTPLVAL